MYSILQQKTNLRLIDNVQIYSDLINDWLATSRSQHTKRVYRSNVKAFFGYLAKDLTSFNLKWFFNLNCYKATQLVIKWQGYLIGQNLAPSTVNAKISAVRSLVKFASSIGKCDYLLNNIKPEKITPYRDTRGITKSQFKSILDCADQTTIIGIRDRAILLLLWSNALRRGELSNCNVADFDSTNGTLKITGKGKSGQPEIIYLSPSAIAAINDWLNVRSVYKDTDPLFTPTHKGYFGYRLTTESIARIVKKYSNKAGIDKVMSPHRIRHSSITEALNITNGDVRSVQKLSRHKNVNTVMIYDDARINAQKDLSVLLDF